MAGIGWPRLKPIVMQTIGYTFLVLGLLGMFLPILQGFLFLFVGLIILAGHATWAKRLLETLRARHPRVDHMIGHAEAKAHAWGERAETMVRGWRDQVLARIRRWNPWGGSPPSAKKQCPCRPDP